MGSIAPAGGGGHWRHSAQVWAERYQATPSDPETAVHYARVLRAGGLDARAVVVLEQAALQNPSHRGVLTAYGRALAVLGHYKRALEVLERAHNPGQPDWRILSVQGAALDQLGRHEEAQRYYGTALRIAPNEPSVLSNLGLSYALSKDLVRAEATLRRAATQSRVDLLARRNLALVVGLQGRISEAEGIARGDLPPDAAAVNVGNLRRMLAQQNGWKQSGRDSEPAVRAQGS